MNPEENASILIELKTLLGVVITLLFLSLLGFTSSGVQMSGGVSVSGAAPPPPVAGVEARCTALGANCACSEPLQSGTTIGSPHNFTDSPAETECVDFLYGGTVPMEMISTTAVSDQPGGGQGEGWGSATLALSHGWTLSPDTNNNWYFWLGRDDFATDTAVRTVCYRYYRQFTQMYGSAGDGETCPYGSGPTQSVRNKLFQNQYGANQIQMQEANGEGCSDGSWNRAIVMDGVMGQPELVPEITFKDCNDAPCRFELCTDGEIAAGNGIHWRARVTSLEAGVGGSGPNGGPEGTYTSGVFNGLGPPTLVTTVWGGDINHSGSSPGGSMQAYFMQATWATDEDHWIGAACEIEGGCP